MKALYILIDSSTKPERKGKSKYGCSAAFWCAIPDDIKSQPCSMGIILREKEGPNKIFYDGVISALIACEKYREWKMSVKIMGDNDHVIKQLKGNRRVFELKPYHARVRELESRYVAKIEYEYISESDTIYKSVDELAKWAKVCVPQLYNKKTRPSSKAQISR